MKEGEKKKECRVRELENLRQRIAELEARQAEWWKAEKTLREINQTLQAIFDASPLAIIALDRGARVKLWSPSAERIFGWKGEDVMGKVHPIVSENTHDEFLSEFTKVLEGKGYLSHEVLRRKKDGLPINLSISTAPLRDAEGGIVGAMGVIADITERVRAREALQKSEERYRRLIETMNDGLGVQDENGVIIYANKRFLEILGYRKEEMIGHPWFFFLDEESQSIAQEQWAARMRGEKSSYNIIWKGKEGKKIHTIVSPTPFFDSEGKFRGSSAVITDVTELKQAEQALKEREKELEIKNSTLEELNAALKVLLKKRDEDRAELEEKVLSNIQELIVPVLEKLKTKVLDDTQLSYIKILESNLNEIISPFSRTLSYKYYNLTPTEMQVANLIKQGTTTKKIADLLNLSPKTIEDHRKNIRTKLGIKNKKANLRIQLLSIQ